MRPTGPSVKHLCGIALAGALWVGALWAWHDPGTFNIDEIHYLLSAQRWAESGNFVISNGYEHFRSNVLLFMHPHPLESLPPQERMTSFIPPLYIFPAALFYKLGGTEGLFALEALSYLVALLLAALMAGRLGGALGNRDGSSEFDPRSAWPAAGLWVFATYFADYGVSIVNHMLSLALALGAVALHPLWQDLRSEGNGRSRALQSVICGLLIGLAFGVRFQNIVTAGVLGAFCLLGPGGAGARVAGFLIGFAPPVAAVGAINFARFGSWNPLSYGVREQADLVTGLGWLIRTPAVLLAGGVLVLIFVLWARGRFVELWDRFEPEARERFVRRFLLVATGLIVLFCLTPAIRGRLAERFFGLAFARAPGEIWLDAGPIYTWGGPRRAFLQGFPLGMAALLLPIFLGSAIRSKEASAVSVVDSSILPVFSITSMIGGIAWANVLFVMLLENNGGFFMNQRYLIDAAAVLVVLAGVFGPRLVTEFPAKAVVLGGLLFAAWAVGLAAAWLMSEQGAGPPSLYVRTLPALFGLVLGLFFLARLCVPEMRAAANYALAILLPFCAGAPLFIHAAHDMRLTHDYRSSRREVYEALAQRIPPESLLVVYGGQREPAGRLKVERDVWVADAFRTGWRHVFALLDEAGRKGWRRHLFVTTEPMPPAMAAIVRENFEIQVLEVEGWLLLHVEPKSQTAKSRP